jgi:hypothetical protein
VDYNLFFDTRLADWSVKIGPESFEKWRARGDRYSRFGDPLFVRPDR